MSINAASLGRSPRLQRALRALQDHGELSTMELVAYAQICAVNSVIAELRANGCRITCRQEFDPRTGRRFFYRLIAVPEGYGNA